MIKYILFDLDGTLTDPALGITNSIMHALSKMGREIPPRESLYCFIGPPLIPAFMNFLGMSEEEAKTALLYYREYFSERGLFENTPYDGIAEVLAELKSRGYRLAVATSKPEVFATRIAERFALAEYFDCICGATLDETRTKKADVIEYALGQLGATPDECIMIGDRHHDIDGAHTFGMKSIGVLWGYGSRDELTEAGADAIAETVADVSGLVEKMK
jgi:phosphoglycolate phosphatase